MSGIAKLKKVELRTVAEEIGLVVNEGMKKSELRRLIEDSDVFKNDNEAVKSAVEDVLETRNKKSDQDSEIEIERLKIERIKLELQLAILKSALPQLEASNMLNAQAIHFPTANKAIMPNKNTIPQRFSNAKKEKEADQNFHSNFTE
ncbi:integrase catalytic domain-containing protein [Nephila pilipes]|uniref:Integrase catalytic domain-containing protein n=1 Tax=Nephila pilipes TaxID=299642 RepID=A0A8X6INK1_NEPPI|nr:integrase catalytic domain-containing protein [Nephila pilipes]